MANDTTNAILDTIQSKLSGVAVDQIKLELFNTVDEVAREALRTTPPTDTSAEPDTWLSSELWLPNYQVLLEGTLARLYNQIGKPYADANLAKAHFDRYGAYLQLSRSDAAAAPSSSYDRLINTIRVQIPSVRDSAISIEAFNTADKIRREALRIDPLAANASSSDWFPTGLWDNCYQAMLHGTLARLFAQTDRPWSNAQNAQTEYVLYQQDLDLVRVEQAKATSTTLVARLLDNLIVSLPGARDNVIKVELYNVLNDFFQDSNIWYEDVDFNVSAGVISYDIFATPPSSIVRLMRILDNQNLIVSGTMDTPGTVILLNTPSTPATYTARVALTVSDPVSSNGIPTCPSWVINKYQNDIIDGVLGRMMAQPAKPYSNAQLAVVHLRKFSTAIALARQEASRQNVYGGQKWRFPQGFNRYKSIR